MFKKSATEGYEKTIGDQYRQDPTLWTTDAFMAADNVLHRKCVYPTVISSALNIKFLNKKIMNIFLGHVTTQLHRLPRHPSKWSLPNDTFSRIKRIQPITFSNGISSK